MSKYEVPDGHWEEDDEHPPQWAEETSATIEMEVYLHDEGYQTDRRWRVHFGRQGDEFELTALYAIEDTNKGNYWREGEFDHAAIDFVDLPLKVRKRVAAVLNRDVSEIAPNQRLVDFEEAGDE